MSSNILLAEHGTQVVILKVALLIPYIRTPCACTEYADSSAHWTRSVSRAPVIFVSSSGDSYAYYSLRATVPLEFRQYC